MLKKSILTLVSSLIFTATAFADDVKIQPVGVHGISFTDVMTVSDTWSNGDKEISNQLSSFYVPAAAEAILKASPGLINNRRVLVSLTIGLVILSQEGSSVDTSKSLMNLSTHKDLVSKPSLTIEEVVNVLSSISA